MPNQLMVKKWIRIDNQVGIERSIQGWDSLMIEYCFLYNRGDFEFLFYNGNGFGESGFGYAICND